MLGGEAVPEALWSELRAAASTRVFNYYGPSEFCIEASGCALSESPRATIGRPVHNTRVYVLDEHLNSVPPGVLGRSTWRAPTSAAATSAARPSPPNAS